MRLKGSLGAKAVLSIDIARFPGKRHGRLGCMPGFLQNSVDIFYGIPGPREAVCSPEGCASILWKSADKAPLAAEAMGIIAPRLKELKLIDSIIPEPLGGAHRNPEVMAASLKAQLLADLADLDVLSKEDLLNRRYQRLMSYGYA
jgi:hypothetical protein